MVHKLDAETQTALSEDLAALETIPRTLSELYTQRMRQLELFTPETANPTKTCFAWLLFSKEDLGTRQLQQPLGIGEGPSIFNRDNLPAANEIVKACQGLITLTGNKASIGFLHGTIREYLLHDLNNWGPDAEATVARGCFNYLNLEAFRHGRSNTDERFESRLRDFPLYRYAALHWGEHLRDISTTPLPTDEALLFLMNPAKVDSASQAMLASGNTPLQAGYSRYTPKHMTGLHLAAYFGLLHIIQLLLGKGQKPNSNDSERRTPLWYATAKGHKEAMVLLSQRDRTTFSSMVTQKNDRLVSSLLEAAGQNIRDLQGRTALHIGAI